MEMQQVAIDMPANDSKEISPEENHEQQQQQQEKQQHQQPQQQQQQLQQKQLQKQQQKLLLQQQQLRQKQPQQPRINCSGGGGGSSSKMKEGDLQMLIMERLQQVLEDRIEEKTIFRVPAWFHENHKELFQPKMVSIGPYHHGKESLHFMEEQKWSFYRDFLKAGHTGMEVYLQEMRALEARARQCYGENIDMGTDDFVKMLLLDGCFLLEHLLKYSRVSESADAFGNLSWGVPNLTTDIVLLENQIPFFVIHELFNIRYPEYTHTDEGHCELLNLFFKYPPFYFFNIVSAPGRPPIVSCNNINHVLHLLHMCMVHNNPSDAVVIQANHAASQCYSTPNQGNESPEIDAATLQFEVAMGMHFENERELKKWLTNPVGTKCASMLNEAGVTFKRKRNPYNMFNITFKNGTLEIPFVSINYFSKIIFSNAAAFEQTRPLITEPATVTGYLALMDALINSEKDVILLEQSKILENMLPDEESAASYFNDLTHFFVTKKYEAHYLFDALRQYSDSTWHKQRARLIHDYFNNPWSAISVVAAAVMLILTSLQTYYSAK